MIIILSALSWEFRTNDLLLKHLQTKTSGNFVSISARNSNKDGKYCKNNWNNNSSMSWCQLMTPRRLIFKNTSLARFIMGGEMKVSEELYWFMLSSWIFQDTHESFKNAKMPEHKSLFSLNVNINHYRPQILANFEKWGSSAIFTNEDTGKCYVGFSVKRR